MMPDRDVLEVLEERLYFGICEVSGGRGCSYLEVALKNALEGLPGMVVSVVGDSNVRILELMVHCRNLLKQPSARTFRHIIRLDVWDEDKALRARIITELRKWLGGVAFYVSNSL